MGADEIGFDVCDDCNHFFGTATPQAPNIDLVFKEIFNASKYSLGERPTERKKYKSAYFHYDRKTDRIALKKRLSVSTFTRQFKRGLYEAFLQKFHSVFPDEPLDRFEAVRRFARYGDRDLKVYYVYNKMILHSTDPHEDSTLHMGQKCKDEIYDTGYYTFFYMGHIIILEVLPLTTSIKGIKNLLDVAKNWILPCDNECGLYELQDFRQLDMFFDRLAQKSIDTRNNLFR